MLKVAVPNKGTLADDALTMLREAGYLPKPVGRALV
ncbi:MAG: ATP phosphoribosyltransferase, partial [Actinomycetes bacterium]